MKKAAVIFAALILSSCSSSFVETGLEFRALSDMNLSRYGFGNTSDGTDIFIEGGGIKTASSFSGSIEKYNPAKNEWTLLKDDLQPRRYGNAEYVPAQNKIYIFNGDFARSDLHGMVKRLEIFDVNSQSVEVGPDNPQPVMNAGSAVWNGKIYFFGGEDSYGVTNRVFEYDPISEKWTRLPDMPKAKQTSGEVIDGVLYVLGGYDGKGMLNGVEAYNINEKKWTVVGKLPERISAHATASDGRNIWIIGSYENRELLACYDTQTGEFRKYGSNMIPKRHSGAQIIGNVLYVFGGVQNRLTGSTLANMESLDISGLK